MSLQQIHKDFKIIEIGKNRYLSNKELGNKRCNSCDIAIHCSKYKGKLVYCAIPVNTKCVTLRGVQKMFCVDCLLKGKHHYSLNIDDMIRHLDNFVGAD